MCINKEIITSQFSANYENAIPFTHFRIILERNFERALNLIIIHYNHQPLVEEKFAALLKETVEFANSVDEDEAVSYIIALTYLEMKIKKYEQLLKTEPPEGIDIQFLDTELKNFRLLLENKIERFETVLRNGEWKLVFMEICLES